VVIGDRRMNHERNIGIIFGIAIIILVSYFSLSTLANEKTYTGEFIRANKVYMPDNNLKLVLYFNDSSDSTKFVIFDDWDAKHSIQLSNMAEGSMIKINYKEYIFRDCKEIVRIELL